MYRAIDSSGALVDVLFREQRDMKAAKAFFRSAQAVTGVTPKRTCRRQGFLTATGGNQTSGIRTCPANDRLRNG